MFIASFGGNQLKLKERSVLERKNMAEKEG